MRRLVIATHNAHKTAEIRAILGGSIDVTDLQAHPALEPPEENGQTFEENAVIKALATSDAIEGLVLADDSGLEVDALDGAPGVRSARYAANNATDAENRAKLLDALEAAGARGKARAARFRCVLALAADGVVLGTFEGSVGGVIINRERGSNGFGYDPIFVPDGYRETFAQLPTAVKNRESHRARALARLCIFLENYPGESPPPDPG